MTRMEAIRKQYEGTPAPSSPVPFGGRGRAYPTRPRNAFWRWFWLAFLLAVLGTFFTAKGTISEWFSRIIHGEGHGKTLVGQLPGAGHLADGGQTGGKAVAGSANLDEASFAAFLNPTLAELNQLCEYVRNSPNVKENLAYSKIMSSVEFFYKGDDDAVNAYAALRKLDKTSDKLTRVIVFLGGAARFGRVASLAVGAELSGDKGAAKRFVDALSSKDLGKFDDKMAMRLARDAGLVSAFGNEGVVTKAKSVSAGLVLGIVAHEAGHQVLNHTLDTSKTVNLEISRNQEREADSFASSVIASSPFGEYILAGTLFWHYALAMQQGDEAVATTHPLSKERFENFVRANSELAATMGITIK